MAMLAATKVYGPYEIVDIAQPEPQTLVTIPYARVIGSQILVTVSDNFGNQELATFDAGNWATAEVALVGRVQGEPYVITRAQLRNITGPLRWVFPAEMMFDQFELAARNMTGGRRGSASTPDRSSAAGFSITLNMSIQPVQRGSIGADTFGFGD